MSEISEKSLNISFSENIVKRCPICFLIPEIKSNFLENTLEYKCPNGHFEKGKFNDIYSKLISLGDGNIKCFCQKNALFYCIKCFKFFCETHSKLEKMKDGHKTIDKNLIDIICLEHGVNISSYCEIENKLFCIYCKKCNHHIKSLNEAFINDIEKYDNNLTDNYNKFVENLKQFDDLKNFLKKIYLQIDKKKNELLDFIKKYKLFLSNILNTYKYKLKNYCISYNNIINIHNNFNQNLDKKIFVNFLNKIKEEIYKKFKINSNFLIENSYEQLKIITKGKEINCIGILNDGRLASGDEKSNFTVYNKLTFKKDIEIFNNLDQLVYFSQLYDNNVIASFYKGNIRIYKINDNNINIICDLKVHNGTIYKVKQLSDENFISCSRDFSFKIWNYKINNDIINIKTHKEQNQIFNIMELKNNIIVYDVYPDTIKFYNNIKNSELNKCINGLNLTDDFGSRFVLINDNELLVGGNKKIYIIDLFNYKLLNTINYENQIFWVLKLDFFNYLIGDDNSDLAQFNIYNKKIISKKNTNQEWICSIANLNGKIITGGLDNTIKIWN